MSGVELKPVNGHSCKRNNIQFSNFSQENYPQPNGEATILSKTHLNFNRSIQIPNNETKLRKYLWSSTRIVNSSRDEHATPAIDDKRPVIVADIERLEEGSGGGNHRNQNQQKQSETLKKNSVWGRHLDGN